MKKLFGFFSLFLLLFLPIFLFKAFSSKRNLYLYSWSAYIKPELIERFQKKYNCSVVLDTYDSNEAMYTKLHLGGSGYDIIFPSNYFLDIMTKEGLIHQLDERKLSNAKYIDYPFLSKLSLTKTNFALPFMVSFSGIAWRKDRCKQEPSSWSVFNNDALQDRMTMLNDMRETIGAGLLYLGFSVNSTDAREIALAQDQVKQWKKHLVKLESEQYKNGIANAEYLVVHGYSGDCLQIAQSTPLVGFSFPKEGSVASVDYIAIMQTSRNKELAYAFINFLLEPKNAAENMMHTYYRCINSEARNFLPEDLKTSPLLYPEDKNHVHFECLKDVGSARKLYVKAWDNIKESR